MVAVLEIKIFYKLKKYIMKILGIVFLVVSVWMAYEIWRAPLMEEMDDGRLVIKRPAKKLSDLFKKNLKTK